MDRRTSRTMLLVLVAFTMMTLMGVAIAQEATNSPVKAILADLGLQKYAEAFYKQEITSEKSFALLTAKEDFHNSQFYFHISRFSRVLRSSSSLSAEKRFKHEHVYILNANQHGE